MGANARRYSQTQIEIIASELPVKKIKFHILTQARATTLHHLGVLGMLH